MNRLQPHWHLPGPGGPDCKACFAGTSTADVGATNCIMCASGTYRNSSQSESLAWLTDEEVLRYASYAWAVTAARIASTANDLACIVHPLSQATASLPIPVTMWAVVGRLPSRLAPRAPSPPVPVPTAATRAHQATHPTGVHQHAHRAGE